MHLEGLELSANLLLPILVERAYLLLPCEYIVDSGKSLVTLI